MLKSIKKICVSIFALQNKKINIRITKTKKENDFLSITSKKRISLFLSIELVGNASLSFLTLRMTYGYNQKYQFYMEFKKMEQKLSDVQWHDFENNISDSFGEVRNDKDLADVTLACEDRDFEVHKLILSASSPFFKALLKRTAKQPRPMICIYCFE